MVGRVFNKYEDAILAGEDEQLFGLARSVDRSVDSYLSRYDGDLDYVIDRPGFLEAEELWRTTGDPDLLLLRLEEDLLMRDELIPVMLVLRDGVPLLSTDGRTDYAFPPGAGREEGEGAIRPCVDGDGRVYLAFLREREDGLAYAALMDLPGFYQRVAGDLTTGTEDRILLLDAGCQTLLHGTPGGVRVERTAEVLPNDRDWPGLPFLVERQRAGEAGAAFHDCVEEAGGSHLARLAVLPTRAGSNGFFAIGVSMNYAEAIRPIRLGAIRLLAYGGMVVAGVLLLVGMLLWARKREERDRRQLEILREKNAAMEELNRKTQDLAHHQRLETIGTLTSSIAHEFNNLLTPIMGYSMLTLEKLPPEETELYDNVLEIYNASRKAKEIIRRLSDLSRKNSAQTFQYIRPNDLVEKVLAVAAPARPAGVAVETELLCRDLWVYGNETQISQMVLNLVLNAFQALEGRGGHVKVSTRAEEGKAVFAVTDDGPGVPPEIREQIFAPFYTTKEAGRGTGLGLAIVSQVAEDHEGSVTVEEAPGGGAVFTAAFPGVTRKSSEEPEEEK